jgi:hypothetical protein
MRDASSKSPTSASSAPGGHRRPVVDDPTHGGQVAYGNSSLHEVFQDQISQILARTDLSEEQKQAILIGMSCPCCGGGAGMSVSLKLKSRD